MNKKELIEKYEYLNHDCFRRVDTSEILKDLKQLDESKKVVVPQFVEDWYKKHEDDLEYDIWEYILHWDKQQNSEFYEWMNHANNKPLQTLINMHQFGYEVEKDKRYIIKLKGVPDGAKFLKCANVTREWYFGMRRHYNDIEVIHTRKELEEAGFGWVFSCEGIEIEEVK